MSTSKPDTTLPNSGPTLEELRFFFDLSLDLLCIANFEGRFTHVNPAWVKALGYTREELTSVPYVTFIHPDDRIATDDETDHLNEGGLTLSFENRYRRKDGSYIWLLWRAKPDVERRLIFATARDITRQKEIEQELRHTTQLQKAILDSANFTIISTDTSGIIQTFNAEAQRLLGYAPEEVIGKTTPILFHEPAEVARHAVALSHELGRHIEPGLEAFMIKARLGLPEENEWTYIRKDGTKYPGLSSVTTLRDEKGRITGLLGVARDITERKLAEREKQETEARLKAILDNATAVIFMKDLEGRYLVANNRWIELFSTDQKGPLGLTDKEVFPPELAHAFREADAAVIAAGEPMIMEEVAPHKDGLHTYLSIKFPLRDAAGKINAVGGIATDITDRKRAEEELHRSNLDLEQFAYVASHDLQEPLRMVTSYLQLLERRYKSSLNEEAQEFMHTAIDGAARMRSLIQDLLAYSRVGRMGHALQPTDCNRLLKTVLGDLKLTIGESGATVTHEHLPTVQADETQLAQVFQNLISNAIKFHGQAPPVVHISVKARNGDWIFAVRDNGIGIEAKFFDRIFVIFQRLHGREAYEGTGIGLALCKRIIERHGGKIWVESKFEQGTTFYFSLPGGNDPMDGGGI